MRSLSRLQHWLAAVYEINVDYDVMDFLVTDQAVACALQGDNNRPDCPEMVFLQQTSGELGISLYLAPEVITGLATGNAVANARDAQVFCYAIEGVSHFLYLVWRAGFDRTLTQLELELQAEIDKFIGLLVLTGGRNSSDVASLHAWLFENVAFESGLNCEARARYQAANCYASDYCGQLDRRYLRAQDGPGLTRELRRFYRQDQRGKLAMIRSLAV